MKKKVQKIAMILSVVIINPIVACLIWFDMFWILFNMPRFLIRIFFILLYPYVWSQSAVMVISSLLTYCLITWNQYLDSFLLKIMLMISNVLFMIMMWIAANEYPRHLPEGPDYAAAFSALFALGATGLFLVVLLFIIIAEYIMRKNDAKSQISKHE